MEHDRCPVDVVSFTFGIPGEHVIAGCAPGNRVWATLTSLYEACPRPGSADLLVVQGYEAGGYWGGTSDAPEEAVWVIALLQLITARGHAVVAAGGIATVR